MWEMWTVARCMALHTFSWPCASELRTSWNRAIREHPLLIIVSFLYTLFSIPTLGHSFLPHAHLKLIICEQVLSMYCKYCVSVCIVYICAMMYVVYVMYRGVLICEYSFSCICQCMCTYLPVCESICMYVHAYVYIHVCVFVCVCVCAYVCTCVHVHMYVCMCLPV